MMFFASSEEVGPCFGGIVQSSSIVVMADCSNQLTTVRDHFDNNQHFMTVCILGALRAYQG